ncbi:hypothetical protein HD806DRAFT_80862 [Xylariaceae sp. AK1471]|nr:hypothetical protein HD806DRAFT_80862 [Xylariaceae sp. AK1471]
MMSSVRSLSLLRATRPHLPHLPSSHYIQHSYIISQLSSSPFHHIHHGRRAFHWQSAVGTAIESTQNLIIELHTITHLPWFLTIPLVALTINTFFRLPFTIYTQRIQQRRTQFGPLLQAWNSRIQQDVQREGVPRSQRMSEVKKRQDKALKRIYRKLGLQQWRVYSSFLSFPFWLLAIDGVRRLCGGPRGLIGSLITSSEVDAVSAATNPGVETTTASHPAATGSIADPSTLDPTIISSAVETARTAVLDPSLTYEGCLWFTDLTVPDPYHILPLALSASLLWNLLPKSGDQFSDRVSIALGRRPKSAQAQILAEDDKVGLGERAKSTLYLGLVALATLVGPLTLDLPAALHLYWLASSATNALTSKALQHLMPVKAKLQKRCTGIDLPVIRPQRDQKN